jgi:hypothetical protein
MARKSSFFGGLATGLGRKIAFEIVNDIKKEHNIKLSPKSSDVLKAIRAFKLGSSFQATASKLIQILDLIGDDYAKDKSTTNVIELKQHLDFVNKKINVLELQITSEANETMFQNVNHFYSQIFNTVK